MSHKNFATEYCQVAELSHSHAKPNQTSNPNQTWVDPKLTISCFQIPMQSRTVQGEDFQMAAWPSNWFWAHSTTSLTWHVPHLQCSYKIHTSLKIHLAPSFFMNLCFGEFCVHFVKSLGKQTCCPILRPSLSKTSPCHPGNALTAKGSGPPYTGSTSLHWV